MLGTCLIAVASIDDDHSDVSGDSARQRIEMFFTRNKRIVLFFWDGTNNIRNDRSAGHFITAITILVGMITPGSRATPNSIRCADDLRARETSNRDCPSPRDGTRPITPRPFATDLAYDINRCRCDPVVSILLIPSSVVVGHLSDTLEQWRGCSLYRGSRCCVRAPNNTNKVQL